MGSGVPINYISNDTMSPSMRVEVTKYADKLISSPIYMDDTAGLNITEFKAKARRLKKKNGIRLIIIDYLQLMESGESRSQNREQEISHISRNLKKIAKELDIPIIALSQLNRSVESRGGEKRPNLSDLRESGSIEQDADRVMFLYRPEYYGFMETSNGESTEGITEIIYAKNRNGPTGFFTLKFHKETNNFSDFNDMTEEDTKKITYNPGADKDDEAPF
jgi:replicative DNA helicase